MLTALFVGAFAALLPRVRRVGVALGLAVTFWAFAYAWALNAYERTSYADLAYPIAIGLSAIAWAAIGATYLLVRPFRTAGRPREGAAI